MEQAEVSALLHIAEIAHWVALAVMGVVYVLRLKWLLQHNAGREWTRHGRGWLEQILDLDRPPPGTRGGVRDSSGRPRRVPS